MIKDDMLGIGAKKGTQDDECTGLDMFQDLLGRLNGRAEEEVEKSREAREKTKRMIWVDKKYKMRFVLGEVYQSSDIEKLKRREVGMEQEEGRARAKDTVKAKTSAQMEGLKAEANSVDNKRKENSKKRKIKEGEEGEGKKAKKKRKGKSENDEMTKAKRDKRDKKEVNEMVKRDRKEISEVTGLKFPQSSGTTIESDETLLESRGRKGEISSKKHKEERKRKKKKGKKEKEGKIDQSREVKSAESSPENSNNVEESQAVAIAVARALTGRQAIRHKYIAAKRGAIMDAQALNEVRHPHIICLLIYIFNVYTYPADTYDKSITYQRIRYILCLRTV